MTDADDALVSQLEPYVRRPGMKAALLISSDGFLVASATNGIIDPEAVAAHIGGVVDLCARLAGELGQEETRFVTFELTRLNVVLSPFGDELLLALIGTPQAISLKYGLAGGA